MVTCPNCGNRNVEQKKDNDVTTCDICKTKFVLKEGNTVILEKGLEVLM